MIVVACGDGETNGDSGPESTPAGTSTRAQGIPTADSTVPPETDGAVVEVQGIVGTVDAAQRLIHVNVLQGADVETIELSTSTPIRDGSGRTLRLTDIRPSDRVIARGRIQGLTLVATQVTVSQVVPGSEPGG